MKDQLLVRIGKRLKNYRRAEGLTKEEVAAELGISPATLGAYERGDREIRMDKVQELARIYNTTITELTDYKNIELN